MFPTVTDFQFFRERQPAPQWAKRWAKPQTQKWLAYGIDLVINAHAEICPTRSELSAALIGQRIYRKQNKLLLILDEISEGRDMADIPHGTGYSLIQTGTRRAAFAKKWAARIRAEEAAKAAARPPQTLALTDKQLNAAIDRMVRT